MAETPMISVFMVTYNHGKFVGKAIESIISQKTNFNIKLFIGEDCSPDNTREVCQDYERRYPELIKVICTETNNLNQNALNILNACTQSGSKYIAFCEGDDYWIDPLKLQKQFDFLEANPDFSMCFTGTGIVDDMGWNLPDDYYFPKLDKDVYLMEDFIRSYMSMVPTATLVCRNIFPQPIPGFFVSLSSDVAIQLYLADKGKAKYMPEHTAMYRNHSGGITKSKETQERYNRELMKLFEELNGYFGYKYDALFRKRFLENSRINLIYGSKERKGLDKLRHYFKVMPRYIKYSDKINFKELAYYHAVLFFPWMLKLFKKPAEA